MKSNVKKEQVLEALKAKGTEKEKFNTYLGLFMSHPLKSSGAARHYNAAGFSKDRLKSLEYDLMHLYGITKRDVSKFKPTEEKSKGTPEATSSLEKLLQLDPFDIKQDDIIQLDEYSKLSEVLPEKLPEWTKGVKGNVERKEWLKEHGIESPSGKNDELDAQITEIYEAKVTKAYKTAEDNLFRAIRITKSNQEASENDSIVKAIEEAPEAAKGGFKIREQYPFLGEDDCPNELKVLVSDMVTAYHKYRQERKELKELLEKGQEDKIYELASSVVSNFELNLEIKAELDHYKEHKEILGNHPIFEDLRLQREVDVIPEADLKSKRQNYRSYISKEQKKTFKDDDSKAKSDAKIEEWKKYIDLIEKRLGDEEE